MTERDDIVERLRDCEGGYGFRAIVREAADEIERLRAERDELLTQRNQLRAEVVDRALRINHPVCWDINSPTRKRCEKYARLRGWHDLWDTVNEQERLLREEATQ